MPKHDTPVAELTAAELLDVLADALELDLLEALNRKVDQIMTDLTALNDAVARLETAEVGAAQELGALSEELAKLQADVPVPQEQIDALTTRVTAVAETLATATTDATPSAPDEPPAPEPPAADAGGSAPPA